ncbi:MAG TPA: DUF4239 domain-containing protein [Nitrosomonas sp.]|nr:DUF4239 domain-containing protein [Nitrosomonas sp.]
MTVSDVTEDAKSEKHITTKIIDNAKRVLFKEPVTRYIAYITSAISLLVIAESVYNSFFPIAAARTPFLSPADKQLAREFIEWFGVLYGFLLPQILVRVWEQFDEIDNLFDSEADAIKILAEDLALMLSDFSETRTKILKKLKQYAEHVCEHHADESKFATPTAEGESKKDIGANYLKEIRNLYREIIHPTGSQFEVHPLISELLRELNSIIDLRGDRISRSSERLYESLRLLSIITSIIWLIPFYYLYYTDNAGGNLPLGLFGWLLVIAVTFLVIIILTIIDDLDNPFDGYWKINISSWEKLIRDIDEMLKEDTRRKKKH